MNCVLEVVDAGIGNALQDGGRSGLRSIGVPVSGAADRLLLACANALLGNSPTQAAIELGPRGPRLLAAGGTLRVALAGAAGGRVQRANGSSVEAPAWATTTLFAGDTISVTAGRGPGYVAVSGGFLVPAQLGSRSTYARARIGGVDGHGLEAGDRLPCGPVHGDPWLETRAAAPFVDADGPLRVILGPQDDHFEPASLAEFLAADFTVTRDSDRMGMRLSGPVLRHLRDKGADIVSDGIAPGAIQVPANGQPIVLLNDAQTVGGYAKIATVIAADLPRLAHRGPGATLRFAVVSPAAARAARIAQAEALTEWVRAIVTFRPPGVIDEAALYSQNLVGGMIDACRFARSGDDRLPWETTP